MKNESKIVVRISIGGSFVEVTPLKGRRATDLGKMIGRLRAMGAKPRLDIVRPA